MSTEFHPGAARQRCSNNKHTSQASTRAVRAGVDSDPLHGAVIPPIYLSSNFSFEGLGGKREYDYTRSGNPTRDQLAQTLADLEGGAGAEVTSTGMSAVLLVCQLLSPGDRLVAPHDCYGGCHRLLTALARRGQFELRFEDFSDPHQLAQVCAEFQPTMIWVETPSNPLLRVTDIAGVAAIARQHRALLVVDNTFLSPLQQRPIELGADLVVHSTTKYINGHSDVVGGAVIARDETLTEQLRWWANASGITASPWDCSQVLRGLRTLDARLRVHRENALALAHLLEGHAAVEAVYFPGLASHPDHALACRQQRGFGAIISFELAGGETAIRAFLDGLEHLTLAESLGGVESLVCHPATMTHAAMPEEARATAGIRDNLLRLSVGIEHLDDLAADLLAGLDRAQQSKPETEALPHVRSA